MLIYEKPAGRGVVSGRAFAAEREGNLPQDYVIMRKQAGGGKVVFKSKSLVLRPFLRDKFKVLNSQSLVLRLFFRDKL